MGICCTPHRIVSVGLMTHLTDQGYTPFGIPRDVVSCSLLHQVHKLIVVIWVCMDICNGLANVIGNIGPVSFL